MRLKLISCEVLYREICAAVARSPHQVDLEFLPKGLHNLAGSAMRERLQEAVDRVDATRPDAVLLAYGLCGNGIAGLTARTVRLVVPRVHDCIALLMGGPEPYQTYFESHPGVYFRSTGWLERGEDVEQDTLREARARIGDGETLETLVARYGEDNGRYLYEQFNSYRNTYSQLTYISTGLEPDGGFEKRARDEAKRRGWGFERLPGDLRLFGRLVSGLWNPKEFLVVPPGWRVVATYDERILDKERLP